MRKWSVVVLLAGLVVGGLGGATAAEEPVVSFIVKSWEFDRGNIAVFDVGMTYADTEPVLVNGGNQPNQAEYDIDFPVTATYDLWAKYTAVESRPVDLSMDGALITRGLTGVTGSWSASAGRWEQQGQVRVEAGKHTFKFVCAVGCIPHIAAFRFDSPVAFPEGWKRKTKAMNEGVPGWSGQPEKGRLGYAAYVRPDGFVDAPHDYDPTVPYDPIPAPNPRGERVLEYLLMEAGRYEVKAAIEEGEEGPWVALLSVEVSPGRTETEALTLDPARVRKMLEHCQALTARFRALGVAAGVDALEREAAGMLADLGRLEALDAGSRDKWEGLYGLYVRAYRLKNRVALSNPLLDFDKLLLVRRQTYDTSHIYTTYFDGSHRYGGGLAVLSPVRPEAECRTLETGLPGPAIYRDPDLSWDGQRVLFSYKPDLGTACRIYEIGLDGSGLRQVTDSNYDDVDPCYLADGRIMFVSTRCRRVVLCHNAFTVSVLHRMNADGSGVECVSQNTVNDFTPSVMHDGRIAYTKWEYVDKQLGNNQSLWVVSPDGSSPRQMAGEHWGPITFWEPRAIPGSSKLVCTLAPHMPIAVGPIALIDPADVCASPAKYESLTPEIPPPHHFGWHRPRMGYYCNPWPLSEDFHVVSYAYGPDDRDPRGYGLYLLDRWGNRDLIYRDPEISCFEAVPLRAREAPPVVPDVVPAETSEGKLCVLDIYRGLPGVERGSIKYLRVIQEVPKPVSAECSGPWLQYPLISYGGHLVVKRLLGEVPVAQDGSAYFSAPANKAIYFAALDANHQEVQRMRALTEVRPGETLSCVGCHEERTSAPPARRPQARQVAAADITPPEGGPKASDFYRDVQPVLNRNCISCHSGSKPAGGLNLSPSLTNRFNVAYESLMTRDLISYVVANDSSTLPLRPAMYYGSHASRLMKVLATTHTDRVALPPEDREALVTWIDMNAPYYGTYLYSRPWTEGGRELLTGRVRGALQAVYQQSCASCHGQDTGRVERVSFEDVWQSPALLAALPVSAGGTGACGAVFSGREDPGAKALMAALGTLEQELRDNPREDVQMARPPITEENPRYVYRP
jgi:cytochrome c553